MIGLYLKEPYSVHIEVFEGWKSRQVMQGRPIDGFCAKGLESVLTFDCC